MNMAVTVNAAALHILAFMSGECLQKTVVDDELLERLLLPVIVTVCFFHVSSPRRVQTGKVPRYISCFSFRRAVN